MPRRELRRIRVRLLFFAAALAAGRTLAAQEPWSLELSTAPSAVRNDGQDTTWWTNRLELGYRSERKDIVYLAGETQRRGDFWNGAILAGGYARRGNWFYFAETRFGVDTTFIPKFSVEGQAGYLVHHTLLSVDYKYLDFQATDVHVGAIAATQSFPWGEAELRFSFGENVEQDSPIQVGLLRALWFVTPKVRVGGGFAFGNGIFDVIAIETVSNEGFTAFANVAYQLTPRDALRLDVAYSREKPSFRQAGGAVSYRRSF